MAAGNYQARRPDDNGVIHYDEEEHRVWTSLLQRQMACIPGRACNEFLQGLERLALPQQRIPQLDEINRVLDDATGWRVQAVPALISFERFFRLLSEKFFPVATFIRRRQEMDYLQEPDIFHELFGHCPLLTHPAFAHFTQVYGRLGLKADPQTRVFLARLYWFTVEFGLVHTAQGLRIYGGGILSSPGETQYALTARPEHQPLDPLTAMRTPYRIDIMQPIYYVLNRIEDLFVLAEQDLCALAQNAKTLGLLPPKFPPKPKAC